MKEGMTRLVHDRYYAITAEHAWDLLTGEQVETADLSAPAPATAVAEPLAEMLEHGRDGEPRWVVVQARAGQSPATLARYAAEQARARGLVPIAADLYLRLVGLLEEELRHRTLMLVLRPGAPLELGRRALMEAATRSPRPHILVSFRAAEQAPGEVSGYAVREARVAYGIAGRPQPTFESQGEPPDARTAAPAVLPEDVRQHLARGARWAEFSSLGRHAAAERLLRDVAGALVRRRALAHAALTLITLGRLLLERGRAADADRLFDEAARHAQTVSDERAVIGARIWQAAARTDAGQLSSAESLCRAVLVASVVSRAERARAEATLARVLLWQGRLEEALARDLPLETGEADVDVFVGATAVRVILAHGDVFAAGQRARDLLLRSEGSGRPLALVIGRAAHARVLMASGDLALAQHALAEVRAATRAARTPLRLVRLRLAWVEALRRAGRTREAEREIESLRRVRKAAPPLLRAAIEGRVPGAVRSSVHSSAAPADVPGVAAAMVALARDEEQDREAVRKVLAFAADLLHTSRLDLWSADAGPDSTIVSVGSGLATALGPRVLDAGITIGVGEGTPGAELGIPVRLGPRLLAALVARWPVDRTGPSRARELLELAAAVAAARIDALRVTAREVASAATAIPELVGPSSAMAEVRRAVARAAAAPFSVLISGETGSGKELVARALHHLSPRRERPFCDLNCAALPDELLESELFGHMRGAFTGAVADRAGLVEEADGGTLFLDEVADLSPRAQAKLLRVLQQQEVRRVGATFNRKVDVRVVAAANRDMCIEAAEGRFRQDLLYRLDVVRIRVPPLRERPEDIPVLAQHFWEVAAARVGTRAALTHGVLTVLSRYHWPGNVRELQNALAGLAVAAPARGQVKPSLLPSVITGAAVIPAARLAEAREQFERRFIEVALARAGGRRARAARELGLSRQGLLKMMARLGLDAPGR